MNIEQEQINEMLNILFKWDKALRNLERKFNKEFDLTLNLWIRLSTIIMKT
jgi:hypothetical protein